MKFFYVIALYLVLASSTCISNSKKNAFQTFESNEIICTDSSCFGKYIGREFVNGSDIAHQFSNKMAEAVGDKLKTLYHTKKFNKVDFENIQMSTKGMGTGKVIYELTIPFVRVPNKCAAFTSFDHSGGWNHYPAIKKRKERLNKVLLPGDSLNISELKTTSEGLQEFWIQWRNKDVQADCIKN
jgi:hypothetical protein